MSEVVGARDKLVVANATKFYDTKSGPLHAVENFSISVAEGEFTCVVGPSGCGKTTLLWSMAGLHRLTSGTVMLDGERVTGPHPQIGVIFQEANLLPWRNLIKNIQLPFEIKGKKPDHDHINHLLERVGLSGFGNKFPCELSGGMQQRAAIVRALSFNPSVLLMDEPFGALDAFTRDEMNLLVEEIWLETRKTIVFITHNIAEAVFLSDRVFVMSSRPGRLVKIFDIPFARPRSLDLLATKEVFDLVNEIKAEIEHKPSQGAERPRAIPEPTPMFAAAGVDPKKIKYLEAGWPQWGTVLASGQGDAALAWEGLRADWTGKGLKFEYWLGVDHSSFPANSFVVRKSDVADPERHKFLEAYLRGWAMGLEFGHQNPRAATELVFKQFPIVKKNVGTELGTESMMQLANVFRGDMSKREGWGWHEMTRWELFFKTLAEIGQVKKPVDVASVVTNEFIGPANTFDMAKVKADADGYELSADMAAVDVEAINKRFFANAVR